ncbi:TPA: GTP-binding protein, partial [Neisseria gonorrhoeae]
MDNRKALIIARFAYAFKKRADAGE